MFIVSKPNLLPRFAGLSAMMKMDPCEAIASSTAALDYFAEELDDDFDQDYISPSTLSSRNSSGSSTGLRRTVSSLQGGESCSHSSPNHKCIVEAKQIEIDVASLTNDDFWLSITSPNGESSGKMRFEKYGKTQRFSPRADGCGHGYWIIEIFVKNADGKTFTKKTESKEYLDGVGSLFYTVNENSNIKLSGQEFLRLPSACQTCSNKSAEKVSSSLIRSAKFW